MGYQNTEYVHPDPSYNLPGDRNLCKFCYPVNVGALAMGNLVFDSKQCGLSFEDVTPLIPKIWINFKLPPGNKIIQPDYLAPKLVYQTLAQLQNYSNLCLLKSKEEQETALTTQIAFLENKLNNAIASLHVCFVIVLIVVEFFFFHCLLFL